MNASNDGLVYVFQGFRLDARRRLLFRADGEPVALPPKVLDTLLYLVERPSQLVGKRTLIEAIWPELIVEENNLDQAISTLRRKLGERPGDNRFIVTEPGRGYRWVTTVRTESRMPARRVRYVPVVVATVALLALGILYTTLHDGAVSDRSIAVLPFADLSATGDQSYFSDGVSEQLIDLLAKIPDLRVVARTSAFSFRNKGATVDEIAEALNVGYVLEGSVRRNGDEVRIWAQLIDARTGSGIWQDTYARTMRDAFAIQDDIAAQIVDRLRIELIGPATTVDRTADPEVYAAYLQARHINRMGLRDSLPLARSLMERAVALDPNYFPARDVLAQSYFNSGEVGQLSKTEVMRLVRKTIDDAEAVWPDRDEIALWRAFIALEFDRDYQAVADHIERVLSRDARNVLALGLAARLALALNRPNTVVRIQEYVLRRDPICVSCYQALMRAALLGGQYERVEDARRDARALGIDNASIEMLYTDSLLLRGQPEAALAVVRGIRGQKTELGRLRASAMAFHSLKRMHEFETTLDELRELPAPNKLDVAAVYAYIGDLDAAFDLLIEEPELPLAWFDGPMKVMRHHPRWPALARKAGAWPVDPRDAITFEIGVPD
jgi:TolB-like protein/DNA-binding winged helix-turn-helix (wHTH) protein